MTPQVRSENDLRGQMRIQLTGRNYGRQSANTRVLAISRVEHVLRRFRGSSGKVVRERNQGSVETH